MLIVESQSLDVYRNLAIEEYLMDRVHDHGPILFLWRSDSAVVVGKNQNPWRECRLDRMDADNVPLARRISGGGTVFHDEGNLNYCVIVDRLIYQKEQAYEMVIRALKPFGIDAVRTGTSNISMGDCKFSGNAFCFRRGRALHHGTLLLNTRLDRLPQYLGSVLGPMETRAIESVPAEVTNLHLGVEEVSRNVMEQFALMYGGHPEYWTERELDEDVLQALVGRQRSIDWIYEATPRFVIKLKGLRVEVQQGRVVSAEGTLNSWINRPFSDLAYSIRCQVDETASEA